MQNRNKIITLVIALSVSILLIVILLIVCFPKDNYEVLPFSLSKYYHPKEELKVSENVGEIHDARTAAKKAVKFWTKEFGGDIGIDEELKIYWDANERCWMVWTTPPAPKVDDELVYEAPLYELFYVIIRENGDVLKFGVS